MQRLPTRKQQLITAGIVLAFLGLGILTSTSNTMSVPFFGSYKQTRYGIAAKTYDDPLLSLQYPNQWQVYDLTTDPTWNSLIPGRQKALGFGPDHSIAEAVFLTGESVETVQAAITSAESARGHVLDETTRLMIGGNGATGLLYTNPTTRGDGAMYYLVQHAPDLYIIRVAEPGNLRLDAPAQMLLKTFRIK